MGVYSVLGASEVNIGNFPKDENFTDNYLVHWYDLFVTFQPTDEISIHWLVHLAGWRLAGTRLEESAKPNGKSNRLVGIGREFYSLFIAYNYNAWGYNRLAYQGYDLNAAGLANSASKLCQRQPGHTAVRRRSHPPHSRGDGRRFRADLANHWIL